MKKLLLLGCTLAACGGDVPSPIEGGSFVYVVFDERHDLEGGERVRLHGFEVALVEQVELDRSRVRLKLSLSPRARANLTAATTFTVEQDGDARYLETHVLDADAAVLAEGDTVEGSDSALELTARRAGAAASRLMGDVSDSEWWNKAGSRADELKRELDAVDWKQEEQELRRLWETTVEAMGKAADEGSEEAMKRIDELATALDKAGRSEEAKKLKQRFERLRRKLDERSSR